MICDLAETYHILDYTELPPTLVATLVVGLRDDARIKQKISKSRLTVEQSLLALVLDGINILIWQRSKDGAKGRNKPESIFKKLMRLDKKQNDDLMSFATTDDFDRWYAQKMRK